nr:hypothetical protein [uncultured Brumimicrobium sp.]
MNNRVKKNHTIAQFLNKHATWKTIFFLFVIVMFFNLFLFPVFHSTNADNTLLDTQFSYAVNDAYLILDKYSAEEREEYFWGTLTLDLIYPWVYGLLLSMLLFKSSQRVFIALIPLVVIVADYLENLGIVLLLYHYPEKLNNVVRFASFFTSLKWVLILCTVLLIIALPFFKRIKRKH